MALGSGGFTAQNKILPGSYINVISLSAASASPGERGTAALALPLSWGETDRIVSVSAETLLTDSETLFGAAYDDPALLPLREALKKAKSVLCYRLGGGAKASSAAGTAKYPGTVGNELTVSVAADPDSDLFTVTTRKNGKIVDTQIVSAASELTDNEWVDFSDELPMTENAGIAFTGGTDGEVLTENYQTFLDLLESERFQTLAYSGTNETIQTLFAEYTKRLRQLGARFQTVLYRYAADSEGIVNAGNAAEGADEGAAVYWIAGLLAGCDVSETAFHTVYNGELTLSASFTNEQLEQAIENGVFLLHKVGDQLRVLKDINSLLSFTDKKGVLFSDNRTIRVSDGIASDVATLFAQTYMGRIPNTAAGRSALRSDLIRLLRAMSDSGAIESFSADDVTVTQGDDKASVSINLAILLPGAMEKLYMTCVVQ